MSTLLNSVIDTLNSTALSNIVMDNAVVFPALEMLHFLGLCLLFGSLLVVDLRIVGFANAIPIERVDLFARFAIIGFCINLFSGLLFVIGDSDRYLVNVGFWIKMGLVFLAGVNTIYFLSRIKPQLVTGVNAADLKQGAHAVAWASLILWTGVIILGRFLPYVE